MRHNQCGCSVSPYTGAHIFPCRQQDRTPPPCTCPSDSEIDAAIEAATNHLLHRGNK